MPLRLIFMGTPDFAVPTLKAIVKRGHEVVAVYTRAPKPAGRKMVLTPSSVHRAADQLRLPVYVPESLREMEGPFLEHRADAAVVVAYGRILPRPILDAPRLGCFNLHASKLPRWRGAAPINRAIMAGDRETRVAVMKMEVGLDTGPIARFRTMPIHDDETAGELHDELSKRGATLMLDALRALERGLPNIPRLTPQSEEGVTYARKIDRDETRIVWQLRWDEVHNHIRGLSPFPGAWFESPVDGKPVRVKVLRTTKGEGGGEPGELLDKQLTIACGEGAIRILKLQRAGGREMTAEEFLHGLPLKPGLRLG
jgi:methionyl-tRNA formyltransferase